MKEITSRDFSRKICSSKYLIFLAMLYVVVTILPSPFVYRLVSFDKLLIPGGVFVFPLIYSLIDIITDVYGFPWGRLIIWAGIACNFIYAIGATIIIWLPGPAGKHYADYHHVFGSILWIDTANFIGVFVGRFSNIYFLSKWKLKMKSKGVSAIFRRNFGANLLGESVMLIVTGTLTLLPKYPLLQIIHILGSDFIIRLIFIFILAIPTTFIIFLLKRSEKLDVTDYGISYNPFKLHIPDNKG